MEGVNPVAVAPPTTTTESKVRVSFTPEEATPVEEALGASLRSFGADGSDRREDDDNFFEEWAATPSTPAPTSTEGGRKSINDVTFRTSSSLEDAAADHTNTVPTKGGPSPMEVQMHKMNDEMERMNRASDIESQLKISMIAGAKGDVRNSVQLAADINEQGGDRDTPSWPDRLLQRLPCGVERLKRTKLWYKRKVQPFRKITLAQMLCVIYILVLTFAPSPVGMKDPESGNIIDVTSEENTERGVVYVNGDYRPVVAQGGWQKFCLAISRMSAFSMYPMLVVVFVTKMKGIQTFLSKTPLSMYLGVLREGHDFHVHAGRYIAFDVWLHTLFHLLRWASAGNIRLLWETNAGITGLITVLATPLITFPMMYFKRTLNYEIRKALHYLFYLFAVAMCFHVPVTAIPNGGFIAPVLGSCIVLYTLDTIYVYMFMCEIIETTSFHVLSSGVRISMPVSDRFMRNTGRAGYAYINIPWINDKQWHPFSLFEDPDDPSCQQMFLMKSGDWTSAVHTALSRDTMRPCWIKGPFPSPYSHAALYDNQILVASGIGITPALAAINAFKSTRRVNLIWAVRDPEMLGFFLEHMYLEHDGWNLIFYTGKKPLKSTIESTNTNIKVIKGRPKLNSVIPNMIYGIESKEGLPEKYTERSKGEVKTLLANRMLELENDSKATATEKVDNLREYGDELGFSMEELIDEIQHSCAVKSFSEYDPKSSGAEKDAKAIMRQLKSSTLMESFSEYDPQSNSAEDDAHNLLTELKSSMTYNARRNPQSNEVSLLNQLKSSLISKPGSSRSLDLVSLLLDTDDDHLKPPPPLTRRVSTIRPPRGRRASMHRWATVRKVVQERESMVLAPSFRPWKEDQSQERCVKRLDDHVMSTWGIMYCGGSKPVIGALRDISMDYNIDLHIDSFKW